MSIDEASPQDWSRRRIVGTATAIAAGPLALAIPSAASAGEPGSPAGLPGRLSDLEFAQAISRAKQDITERQALYGLLFNGDGEHGPDRAKWGDEIFTPDAPFIAYDPNLAILPAQTFYSRQPLIDVEVARQPKEWPTTSPNGSMHYMYNPVFDEISLTEAKTRTQAMIMNAVKGTRIVNTVTICVYHDEWKNTDVGWRKSQTKWYRLT